MPTLAECFMNFSQHLVTHCRVQRYAFAGTPVACKIHGQMIRTRSSVLSRSFRLNDSTQSLKQRSTTLLYILRLQKHTANCNLQRHETTQSHLIHLSLTCISSICVMRAFFCASGRPSKPSIGLFMLVRSVQTAELGGAASLEFADEQSSFVVGQAQVKMRYMLQDRDESARAAPKSNKAADLI